MQYIYFKSNLWALFTVSILHLIRQLDIKKDYIPIKMQSSGILGAFLVSSSGFASKLQLFTFWIVWRSMTCSFLYMLWLYWGSPRSVRVIVSLVTSSACRSWAYTRYNHLQTNIIRLFVEGQKCWAQNILPAKAIDTYCVNPLQQ